MQDQAVKQSQAPIPTKQSRNRPIPSRHSRLCVICNHPDRAAIEFDFLNWRNPGDIVRAYRFRGLSTIYRHAHATGLFCKRRLNLRFALERIVERVNEVPVTANAVIRAARAVSRINDSGEWVDPPSRLIVEHVNADESRQSERRKLRKTEKIAKSRPVPTFDPILLDEPSDSASCELPRINGKPPEPEIVLEIAPSLYGAVQAGRGAANVRLAPWSNPEWERLATAAYCSARSAEGGAGTVSAKSDGGRTTEGQSVAPPSSSLPEAAFDQPAPASMAPSAARETRAASEGQSAASSSSSLPQAASNSPATACPEQSQGTTQPPPPASNPPSQRRSGPPLGSSGSTNPPFPFDPPPLRRWKPRRRF